MYFKKYLLINYVIGTYQRFTLTANKYFYTAYLATVYINFATFQLQCPPVGANVTRAQYVNPLSHSYLQDFKSLSSSIRSVRSRRKEYYGCFEFRKKGESVFDLLDI